MDLARSYAYGGYALSFSGRRKRDLLFILNYAIIIVVKEMIKKVLVPHKKNDFRPYLLRTLGIILMFAFIGGALFASQMYRLALRSSDYLASVLPSVLVDLANDDRQGEDLALLTPNPLLEEAARLKAEDMVSKGYFAHYSPEGVSPWRWMSQAGYEFVYAGENLAVNFDDSAAVNEAWMRSPGHRENILNGHFTEIGIAVAKGVYEGRETLFVVEMFGSPVKEIVSASGEVAVVSKPKPKPKTPAEVPEVTVTPIASSSVLGAESQTFLSVKNANVPAEAPEERSEVSERVSRTEAVAYASLSDTFLTSPSKLLASVYLVLSLLLVVLLLAVLSVKHEHRLRHTVFTVLVFVIIVAIYYTYQLLAPTGITVLAALSP